MVPMSRMTPAPTLIQKFLRWRALVLFLLITSFAMASAPEVQAQKSVKMLPLKINKVVIQDGNLVALGSLGDNTFVAPLTLAVDPIAQAVDCPVLNLSLGPIDLNLLGLRVVTSPICLDITAVRGALLGDLLCAVANLLNGGLSLDAVLSSLTSSQQKTLTKGLTDLLNGVLQRLTSSSALQGASCDVLNLALGPLDLNLLGLVVELDNCSGGPVTLDIIAIPGSLLGDLLCALSNLLSGGGDLAAITNALRAIAAAILLLL